MYKYVLRRLLLAVPVLLLSSLIVFGVMRVMPGDALTALMAESGNVGEKELAKLRRDLQLDRPYVEQYALWLWQMVSFRPGDSIFTGEPIATSLKKSIPVTLELATLALILGLVIADRKSTRLNSSHLVISYAVFCLKKKKKQNETVHTKQIKGT